MTLVKRQFSLVEMLVLVDSDLLLRPRLFRFRLVLCQQVPASQGLFNSVIKKNRISIAFSYCAVKIIW